MLELKWDEMTRLGDAKVAIVAPITNALFDRRKEGDSCAFDTALWETHRALTAGSFNNYEPRDEDVWAIISGTIRKEAEFERERLYLLATIFIHLAIQVSQDFDLKFFGRMCDTDLT